MKKLPTIDCRSPIDRESRSFDPRGRRTVSPIVHRQSPVANSSAFSLVEVTIALGIVSFSLVAILGLLPVGLKMVKNADEQRGGGVVLTSLAEAVRSARTTNNTNFTWTYNGQDYPFTVGQTGTVSTTIDNLNLEGMGDVASERRFTARVEIIPPTNLASVGRGTLSVAWSAQANPTWDSTTKSWTKADGALTTGIQFLTQP